MEVAFVLCDAAQVGGDGKVYILGAGWRVCGPVLPQHAVVAIITMDHEEVGVEHELALDLIDEDGHVVTIPTPQGALTMRAEGTVRGERAANMPEGVMVDVAFVAPVGAGLPLGPGTYVWQLWLNGETREDWRCPFYVLGESPAAGNA